MILASFPRLGHFFPMCTHEFNDQSSSASFPINNLEYYLLTFWGGHALIENENMILCFQDSARHISVIDYECITQVQAPMCTLGAFFTADQDATDTTERNAMRMLLKSYFKRT